MEFESMKNVYVLFEDNALLELPNADFRHQYGHEGAWVYCGEELIAFFPHVKGIWRGDVSIVEVK